jgi:hypothetical protein
MFFSSLVPLPTPKRWESLILTCAAEARAPREHESKAKAMRGELLGQLDRSRTVA